MSETRISNQQLPTLRVQSTAAAADPALAEALAPGTIVAARIQREPGAKEGIVVSGSFVPALIPPELEHDAVVDLIVVRNTPAIILRVVSLDPKPLAARPSTLLDSALKALLTSDDVAGLKEAFRAVDREVGQSLGSLTKSLDLARPQGGGPLSDISRRLTTAIETNQVLDEPIFKEPAALVRALQGSIATPSSPAESAVKNLQSQIASTVDAVEDLNRALREAREIPLALKTIETIRGEIAKLRADPAALTFENSTPSVTPEDGSDPLTAPAHSLAIAAGRSHSFADIGRRAVRPGTESTPLILFLRALGALLPDLSRGESPMKTELGSAVRYLISELNRIPPGPQERSAIESVLTQAQQRLETIASGGKARQEAANLLVNSADISRQIERVTDGQDILRYLAPVAQSVGEPVAMFLPAVVHGLLTKFEFAFYPAHRPVGEDETDLPRSPNEFFERIDLNLPLPALGSIHVAIARRPGEALINFTCAEESARNFLETMLPRLEDLLGNLGYDKRMVAATVGEVPSALPEWCRTITRSEIVA